MLVGLAIPIPVGKGHKNLVSLEVGCVLRHDAVMEKDAQTRIEQAAERALAEAAERKAKAKAEALPLELGGRDGPEPTRFGDWEKKGITSDF